MVAEKLSTEVSETIAAQIESLAEFISEESLRTDRIANASNWLIFERYNRAFTAIALEMGYDPAQAGNDDWGSLKLINSQLTSFDWYEGKGRDWLQKCRCIARVASSIYEKCVVGNALFDEIDWTKLSYEKCRLIAASALPLEEKRVLWFWMEAEKPTCRQIRAEIKQRTDAHEHVTGSSACEVEEDEETYAENVELLGKEFLEAIATEIISKVQAGEIIESEKLIAEIARRVRQ